MKNKPIFDLKAKNPILDLKTKLPKVIKKRKGRP